MEDHVLQEREWVIARERFPPLLITIKTYSSHLITIQFLQKVRVLPMAPTENPSSSKTEQEASKKSSNTREDTDADERPEGRMSPQDGIKWYKEEILGPHPSTTFTNSRRPPSFHHPTDQQSSTEKPFSQLSIALHQTRESKRCRSAGPGFDKPATGGL